MFPQNLELRFWQKVNKNGPVPPHRPELGQCWVWLAFKDKNGYARITHRCENRLAARVLVEHIQHQTIPMGQGVLHKCDNPACINPCHLFFGTPADNTKDMMDKGRHRYGAFRPEDRHNSVLTADTAKAIKLRSIKNVEEIKATAAEFGVSRHTIYDIIKGRTWVSA